MKLHKRPLNLHDWQAEQAKRLNEAAMTLSLLTIMSVWASWTI